MAYAAIGLALLGFEVGIMFRLQVLLIIIALLLLFSVTFAFGSGLSFSDALMTILAIQTVIQGSYFLGLMARAAVAAHGPRHIL
jgi:hypothetical protein